MASEGRIQIKGKVAVIGEENAALAAQMFLLDPGFNSDLRFAIPGEGSREGEKEGEKGLFFQTPLLMTSVC
ncbi:hypothetical protein E2C01_094413 [Portunus trituberculatus]|uniref:Uncharacterized protein n=1 Tax=Portunus trituberculatus TaxID=210409 RepID=A0A5B7JW26_PORTR|nr:hypothetical protein [Portunus trituberculatus]